MLYPAKLYEEELTEKFYNIWFSDKNKYWNNDTWYQTIEINNDTWETHQFVSVREKDDEVVGYISYDIDRQANIVSDIGIINFGDTKAVFSKDVMQAIDDIFCKFNFKKIEFSVVVGNPAEKIYDKFIAQYGGRVVGTWRNHTKLIDGEAYDTKMYELFREMYIHNKKGHDS